MDYTVANLHEVKVPDKVTSAIDMLAVVPPQAPEFVQNVTAMMMAGRGDELPVSALPIDGTYPSGTTKWEKRNISQFVPVWEPEICIQCGNCSFVCPHGVIRSKLYDQSALENAPASFKSAKIDARGFPDTRYTLQIYAEDCTGCTLCVEVCPAKSKEETGKKAINMAWKDTFLENAKKDVTFFETLPVNDRSFVDFSTIRGTQFLEPLFEFSGRLCRLRRNALREADQPAVRRPDDGLQRHRLLVHLRRQPADDAVDGERRGPRTVVVEFAVRGQRRVRPRHAAGCRPAHAARPQADDRDGVVDRRRAGRGTAQRLAAHRIGDPPAAGARRRAEGRSWRHRSPESAKQLLSVADHLVKRAVWIVGGDGWAYDIGSSGLDHVLSTGRNVNILVLDTEVYSNTGGQASKSTPIGAVAKFANAGKAVGKKDIALQAISYGNVYVARVAMGANPQQTLLAFREAEAYDGPSLVLAYSHCIAHGINMQNGLDQQSRAVHSGYWPLMRYNPEVRQADENPFVLDSPRPTMKLRDYADNELRYRMLRMTNPKGADRLMQMAQAAVDRKWKLYEEMATLG